MRALFVFSAKSVLLFLLLHTIFIVTAQAQEQPSATTATPLITEAIDESHPTTLKGNTHPLARPEFDLGTADGSLPVKRMLLVLKRSDDQEHALRKLLDDQQDKHSPAYHKWLTPEQFGEQFGPADSDMQTITSWLQSYGFQVGSTKGRTVLEFSGTAGQVQEAFHTTIHGYLVNGQQHWANASDPAIPTALMPAVAGISSLNNFPRRAMYIRGGVATRDKSTGKIHVEGSQDTWPQGCIQSLTNSNYCNNWLAPYDFATIYDVLPLWNAGINGTGQTIAIVGESNINIQDVADFRSLFGLPVNNPTVIVNGPDPGIQPDESEADLDVQWSGGVAPNATIDFVVSQSTETTTGTDLSAVYIIENNLASVMSESYGECELGLGTAGNQFYNTLWQQAAAQGITVFIAAGDNGAAGCDNFDASSPAPAQFGLQVSGYASTPYNVAVGGTDFNQFTNPGTYWSTTNNPTTQASALSYIPETTWNDSCTNALWVTLDWGSTAEAVCNNSKLNDVVPVGGSGGSSNCTTPSGSTPSTCTGGYSKPSWQTGTGVPSDGKRDLPDVSLFASNGFLGSSYIICQADQSGPCPSTILGIGGTSASSPAFAGIMALVNQQYGRQGNANYILYKLAAQQPTAFHDVTGGTIAMPCATGSPNCVTNTAGDAYGVLSGYNAAAGYDLATGLGSIDADKLVTKWNSVTLLPSTTTLTSLTPTTITHGQAVNFTVSVAPKSGTGTPTGQISLEGGPTSSTNGIAAFSLTSGSVSGSTEMLPGGTYSVVAHYPGDSTFGPSDSAATSVTVNKENSQPQVFLVTFDSNGNVVNGDTNTAVYGSPYVLRVNVNNAAGKLCSPVSTTGSTACPTGNVTLTNNGSALDAGTYALNSYGYFEDQTVQLPGGTNSIQATYAGDNSFNAGSAASSMSIAQANTTVGVIGDLCNLAGCSALLTVTVDTQSSGAEPSGTVTFFVNGSPPSGQTTYSGSNGSAASPASLTANVFTSFPNPGTYHLSASYSGDADYIASSSAPQTLVLQYQTPLIVVKSASSSVQSGSQATLTAEVIATGSITPTGTLTFNAGAGFPLPNPTYSTVVNPSSGHTDLVGTVTFTPQFGAVYYVQYSGDANYPGSSGTSSFISVSGNDFTLVSDTSSATVDPGQSATVNLFVGVQSSQVNFAASPCSGLPNATTCTINMTAITQAAWPVVTIKTTAASATLQTKAVSQMAVYMASAGVVSLALLVLPIRRRRSISLLCVILVLVFILPNCGGGSSGNGGGGGGGGGGGSGGGGNPGTPAGTYPITITASSGTGSSAISHSVTFTLTVQ